MKRDVEIPPDHLFRYCSLVDDRLKWAVGAIEHSELYFCRCNEFNDPWDSRPAYRFPEDLEAYFYKLKTRHEPNVPEVERREFAFQKARQLNSNPKELEKLTAQQHDHLISNYGLLCLSERPDNPGMWSRYADGHRGICLMFSTDIEQKAFCFANKVAYQEDYPIVTFDSDDPIEIFCNTFLVKSLSWRDEEEWRLADKGKVGWQPFPREALAGVILGAKISQSHRGAIVEANSRRKLPVPIMEAKLHPSKFALNIDVAAG